MKKLFSGLVVGASFTCLVFICLFLVGCPNNSTTPAGGTLTGSLVYDTPGATPNNVNIYDNSTQKQRVVLQNGYGVSWTKDGNILYQEPAPNFGPGSVKIVISTPNGASKTTVLDTKLPIFQMYLRPRMSPDGAYICFNHLYNFISTSPIYDGFATIIMKSNGELIGGLDSLFDGSWAPDGSLVVSGTSEQLGGTEITIKMEGLFRLSADFSSTTVISTALSKPKFPAVSPDGKRVAFSMNKHIWLINIDGTGLRQITTGSKQESFPCWSPDGKFIACICYGTFESTFYNAMAAVPADASSQVDLTNDSPYWLRDSELNSTSSSGRLNPFSSISWK